MNGFVYSAVAAAALLAAVAAGAAQASESAWKVGEPIVTYYAGPELTNVSARLMKRGGWNTVWCNVENLDVARKFGLRGMLHNPLLQPSSLDDAAKRAELDALVDRVKNHPAMYSYYLTDEPDASRFDGLGRLVAYLRDRDPAHMAYINLFPIYASDQQLGTTGTPHEQSYRNHLALFVDRVKPALLSYDNYIFFKDSDGDSYFQNLGIMREFALKSGVPFLNIVQASSWDKVVRVPNAAELRWLVYTTLGYGAQGISYYVFYAGSGHEGMMIDHQGKPTHLYNAAKRLNPEFANIARELQKLESIGVYHAGSMPLGSRPIPPTNPFRFFPALVDKPVEHGKPVKGLMMGCFGKNGRQTHVMVVNTNYSRSAVTTLDGPAPLEVFDALSGEWTPAGSSSVNLNLQPGGGKFVRLK